LTVHYDYSIIIGLSLIGAMLYIQIRYLWFPPKAKPAETTQTSSHPTMPNQGENDKGKETTNDGLNDKGEVK
jgi:hypothetical protein